MCNHARRLRGARPQPPVKLQAEDQVRQLRLRIRATRIVASLCIQIVEVQLASFVRDRRHRHHATRRLAQERRKQEPCQRKMAKMVGAELYLETLRSRAT